MSWHYELDCHSNFKSEFGDKALALLSFVCQREDKDEKVKKDKKKSGREVGASGRQIKCGFVIMHKVHSKGR